MIRDITIGQYYPADSVIHKLDPRTKLVGTIGFIVSVFLYYGDPTGLSSDRFFHYDTDDYT